MQYLLITKKDTLSSISKIIGQQNIEVLLAENRLQRTPKIGEAWATKCDEIIENTPNEVTAARKTTLLNSLTGSEEVFEKACLMDEDEWKVFSALQAFTDALRIPESVKLPYSTRVIGDTQSSAGSLIGIGNVSASTSASKSAATPIAQQTAAAIKSGAIPSSVSYQTNNKSVRSSISSGTSSSEPVSSVTYQAVMKGLKSSPNIDPNILNRVNTSPPVKLDDSSNMPAAKTTQFAFNIPWGKVQIYSSLLKETIDFPAYPEEIQTTRSANYTSMPDIIYQYEPWIIYESSGPREQSLNFHLHRDMWTGNHLDGNANKLVRFCEANTFPDYQGSNVISPYVRFYIDGNLFISGVIVNTTVNWSGPLGLDNWYLEFNLSLSIREVSEMPLNINSIYKLGIKGS